MQLVGDSNAIVSHSMHFVGRSNASVSHSMQFVGRSNAIVSHSMHFVGRSNAIVSHSMQFVGRSNAIVSHSKAIVKHSKAIVSRSKTIFTTTIQFHYPSNHFKQSSILVTLSDFCNAKIRLEAESRTERSTRAKRLPKEIEKLKTLNPEP